MNNNQNFLDECNSWIDQIDSEKTNIIIMLEKLSELIDSEKSFTSFRPTPLELGTRTGFIYQYGKKNSLIQIETINSAIYQHIEEILQHNSDITEVNSIHRKGRLNKWITDQGIRNYKFIPILRKTDLIGVIGFLNFNIDNNKEKKSLEFNRYCIELGEKIKKIEKKERKKIKKEISKIILNNSTNLLVILNERLQPLYISPSYFHFTNQKEVSIIDIHDIKTINFDITDIKKWKFPTIKTSELNCNESKNKIILEHQINSILNKKNNTNYYLITSRDVTEREQLIRNLKQNLKNEKDLSLMKTKFISMTSHEFKTPLSTILSSVDILELLMDKSNDVGLKEKSLTHLRKIQIQINRLNRILSDIFIVDKSIDSKLNNEKIDLNSFTQQIIINYFSEDDLNKIDLKFQEEKIIIHTDKDALITILRNLIENSLKYGQNLEKKIIIETKVDLDYIYLSIEDFGIGIPKIDQSHIFEIFYRSGNVNNIEGTGLGLSIVKELVLKLGLKLEFTSKEGNGTKFTIKFTNEKVNTINSVYPQFCQ